MSKQEKSSNRVSRRSVLRLGASLTGLIWSTGTTQSRTVAADNRAITCGTPYFSAVRASDSDQLVFRRNGAREALFVINNEAASGKLFYDITAPSGKDLASGTIFSERTIWDYAFPYVSLDEPGDYEIRVSTEASNDEPTAYYVYRYCDDRQGSGPPLIGQAKTGFNND